MNKYTTKTCCVCGAVHEMPLGKRVMDCACGNCIDRDHNSAVNIMVRFLSQNALWTGYRQFAGNLRQTGPRIPETRALAGSPLRKRGVVHDGLPVGISTPLEIRIVQVLPCIVGEILDIPCRPFF